MKILLRTIRQKKAPVILGFVAFIIGSIICIYSFFQYPIDPLGYIFLPFFMLIMASLLGLLFFCIGYILQCCFLTHEILNLNLLIALICLWPILLMVTNVWQMISPASNHTIGQINNMDMAQLDAVTEQVIYHPDFWYLDREFKLGTILRNSQTSTATLMKIASINDKRLYQKMSFAFSAFFDSPPSIMSMVVNHPHVTPAILAKIYPKANQALRHEITKKLTTFGCSINDKTLLLLCK